MGGGVESTQVFFIYLFTKNSLLDHTLRPTCNFLILAVFYDANCFFPENLVYKKFYYISSKKTKRNIDLHQMRTNRYDLSYLIGTFPMAFLRQKQMGKLSIFCKFCLEFLYHICDWLKSQCHRLPFSTRKIINFLINFSEIRTNFEEKKLPCILK